jgi:hypothetical protein
MENSRSGWINCIINVPIVLCYSLISEAVINLSSHCSGMGSSTYWQLLEAFASQVMTVLLGGRLGSN